jgi:3-dehydroquinate synthase
VRTLEVGLGERAYPIHIGDGLLRGAADLLPAKARQRAVIVTNAVVAAHHLATLQAALRERGVRADVVLLPDGEAHKSLATLDDLLTRLLELRAERSTTLIALGGGVVGDIAGFAAAVYQRGIPFVQIPTTLLAQVDSSVGGKTGVNHPLGKNMIGAFWQPRAVLIDTAVLATLPERELRAGIAEVIKYGAIRDADFFAWLEASLRALLNFGHTFGHAIEAAQGYGAWLHGEAVAAGMVCAARLSERVCGLDPGATRRLANLIAAGGLPTAPPKIAPDRWLDLMRRDKKVEQGTMRFVLLERIGHAVIRADVAEDAVAASV